MILIVEVELLVSRQPTAEAGAFEESVRDIVGLDLPTRSLVFVCGDKCSLAQHRRAVISCRPARSRTPKTTFIVIALVTVKVSKPPRLRSNNGCFQN